MKTHYIGGLRYTSGGQTVTMLSGWASCCTGRAAIRIKTNGNTTRDRTMVTCKTCLRNIAKECAP